MCTRFFIDESQRELAQIIRLAVKSPLTNRFIHQGYPLMTRGEICPTNVVPVIAPSPSGKTSVYPMKWGFTDSEHGNFIYNARSESAGYKPMFNNLWTAHRCVIPTSYYCEWQHYTGADGRPRTGEKYIVQTANSEITWLCGLYRIENDFPVFVVLTREPCSELAEIHERMPVIISGDRISDWVSPEKNPAETMQYALTDVIIEQAG